MRDKIKSGSSRDKTEPTKKQNKYNNPLFARKIYFQLIKRMSERSAKGVITKRRRK